MKERNEGKGDGVGHWRYCMSHKVQGNVYETWYYKLNFVIYACIIPNGKINTRSGYVNKFCGERQPLLHSALEI